MATDLTNTLPEGYQLDKPGLPEGYTLDPETSAAGALGRGALDAVPFGTKGAAAVESGLGSGTYDKYLAELDAMLQKDKETHPIAHGAGELAGTVAPFAIPGVGEALGAESLGGRAAVGAGMGALNAASETRNDLTSPEGLKDIAKGAGTGALINPAVGGIADKIAGMAEDAAPSLNKFANIKAVQAGNLRPQMLGIPADELDALGQQMRDLDLVNGATSERAVKAQVHLNKLGDQFNELKAGSVKLGDATPFTDNLQNEMDKSSKFFGTEGNHDLNMYRQGIANIQNNGKDFNSLQMLKSAYGEKAFDNYGNVSDKAAAKIYGQIKEAMKSVIATAPEEYQELMNKYSTLKTIQSGITRQLQHEQANGVQAKGFGLAGKMGGMLLGGNVPATAGAAALLAPFHPFMAAGVATTLATNPQLMSNTAGRLAEKAASIGEANLGKTAPVATNMITQLLNHPAMSQYKPVFQQAVQGLQDPAEAEKKTTVTDFIMSQRDPNYSKAKQTAQDAVASTF